MTSTQKDRRTEAQLGKDLPIGSRHYRAFVGPGETYDAMSAIQFNLLTFLGLREGHFLLDIGCGSLRGGRLFIPYLLPGRYFGIEPEQWLVEEGIRNELGSGLIDLKRPMFRHESDFALTSFNQSFDFILAQSIFSHASQAQIRICLAEASKVMTPKSIFAATYVKGDENYEGEEWVYPGCVTYTEEHLEQLAQEQGLLVRPIDWPQPAQQSWVVFTTKEHEGGLPTQNDTARVLALESEVGFLKQRLARLEGHPYHKFGLKARAFLRRFR